MLPCLQTWSFHLLPKPGGRGRRRERRKKRVRRGRRRRRKGMKRERRKRKVRKREEEEPAKETKKWDTGGGLWKPRELSVGRRGGSCAECLEPALTTSDRYLLPACVHDPTSPATDTSTLSNIEAAIYLPALLAERTDANGLQERTMSTFFICYRFQQWAQDPLNKNLWNDLITGTYTCKFSRNLQTIWGKQRKPLFVI